MCVALVFLKLPNYYSLCVIFLIFLLLFQVFAFLWRVQDIVTFLLLFFLIILSSHSVAAASADYCFWFSCTFVQKNTIATKAVEKTRDFTETFIVAGEKVKILHIFDNRLKFSLMYLINSCFAGCIARQFFLFCSQVSPFWSTHNNLKKVLKIQIELWVLFNSCSLLAILHFNGCNCFFNEVYSYFLQIILNCILYTSSHQQTSLAVVTTGKVSPSTDCVYLKLFQHT